MAIAQCCIYIYGLGGAALLYTVINPDIGMKFSVVILTMLKH